MTQRRGVRGAAEDDTLWMHRMHGMQDATTPSVLAVRSNVGGKSVDVAIEVAPRSSASPQPPRLCVKK